MSEIEIEHCGDCGHLGAVLAAERELLQNFGKSIASLRVVAGEHTFKVRLDDQVVWDEPADELVNDVLVERVAEHVTKDETIPTMHREW